MGFTGCEQGGDRHGNRNAMATKSFAPHRLAPLSQNGKGESGVIIMFIWQVMKMMICDV